LVSCETIVEKFVENPNYERFFVFLAKSWPVKVCKFISEGTIEESLEKSKSRVQNDTENSVFTQNNTENSKTNVMISPSKKAVGSQVSKNVKFHKLGVITNNEWNFVFVDVCANSG